MNNQKYREELIEKIDEKLNDVNDLITDLYNSFDYDNQEEMNSRNEVIRDILAKKLDIDDSYVLDIYMNIIINLETLFI